MFDSILDVIRVHVYQVCARVFKFRLFYFKG